MGILKKLSLRSLIDRFGQTFKRFPVAMLLIIFLTCFLLYMNHGGELGDKLEFFLMFYPSTGALLAVALSLLTEDFKSKTKAVLTQVAVHLIWLGVSVYLAQFERFSLPQIIAVSATVAAIGLAVFLICFYRKRHEIPFWNFSIRTVLALGVSAAIGGILCLGLLLLVESLKMLFSIEIDTEVYMDIWTVCMVLLAPTLFQILIPKGENKYLTEVPEFSRFAKGVVQYLFLPLLGLYMITLYAYAAKILFQWSLPVGNVSLLVSGSMVLMVLLIYFTYPIQHLEGNKLFKRVTRWLPVLMLPLLALMTVAIGRRLSDYGITVSRLYLLVFNIWCYGVCLWLIFTRNKRIWLIPASFAIILFLISVGPQSIANITQRQLLGEARKAFTTAGFKQFPLSAEQYEKWLKSVDTAKACSIDDKLYYLNDIYGSAFLSDLISEDAHIGRFSSEVQLATETDTDMKVVRDIDYKSYRNTDLIEGIPVLNGYERMAWIDDPSCEYEEMDSQVVLNLRDKSSGMVYRIPVRYDELEALDDGSETKSPKNQFLSIDGNAVFVINEFHYAVSNDGSKKDIALTYSGLLFMK